MARTKRDTKLDSRSARLKLPIQKAPFWAQIAPRQSMGYHRPKGGSTGAWLVRRYEPNATIKIRQERLGSADDYTDADGVEVLTFIQAQEKAQAWFRVQTQEAILEAEGEVLHRGPYTVADAIHDYLVDGKRRGMKGHHQTECSANANILPELGIIEVGKLTRNRIEKWLTKLADSGRRLRTKRGADSPMIAPSPTTEDAKRARKDSANRVLTILKAALNHALDRRRAMNGTEWQTVKPFREVSSVRIRFLTTEDQVRLVNVCPEDFGRLVRAALLTGARYGELIRLKVQDFHPNAGKNGAVRVVESKSGKPRDIALTSEGRAFFDPLVAGKPAGNLILQRDQVLRRTKKETGLAWGKSEQGRFLDRACLDADIEKLTFHELRHTYASTLLMKGASLLVVAKQLGHSDTRMVEKHYGHLAPNFVSDAIDALGIDLGIASPTHVTTLIIQPRSL